MIEAVNSAISNAQLTQGVLSQSSSARSFAADVSSVESVANSGPSPFIVAFDTDFDRAILQVQDSATGDVLRQIPTERTLELRQVIAARESVEVEAPTSTVVQQTQTSIGSSQDSAVIVAQSVSAESSTSTAGTAQVAIAALSAGAQSGQPANTQVNVTA